MKKGWPQFNLTEDQWQELLGIEYTLTMYPRYYVGNDYEKAENRLQELRQLRHQQQ